MKLLDYTTSNGFLPRQGYRTVEEAVNGLVSSLEATNDVERDAALVRDVMKREVEGSTAIGGGLVIPHARSRHARSLGIAVATLDQPLDIPSDDGQPVDIIILLVGPMDDSRPMLRLLARLARLVKQGGILDELRAAESPTALRRAFALAGEPAS